MPKQTRRLSSNTTFRSATPSSPEVAKNFMNFRFNHLTQRNTLPDRLGCAYETNWGPCNASGEPAVAAKARTGQALSESGGMVQPRNDPGAVKV